MGIKAFVRQAVNRLAYCVGSERVLKLEAKIRFHKTINIDHPVTLSDKICYLELRKDNPLAVQCSDKYEVREYVKSKGLENILVPLLGVYESVEEINFDSLPKQFVLKATYGSKMNLICADKCKLDLNAAKKKVRGWLKYGFNRDALEPHYEKIQKRIICEKFLESADSIIDYKIHCLNGEPRFVLVCTERNQGLKLNLYDLEWNPINEICGKHLNTRQIKKPKNLKQMIEISKSLSGDFDFVRVDLYQIGDKVYFGELTFTPDGGMLSYYTDRFDRDMGEQLKITDYEKKSS